MTLLETLVAVAVLATGVLAVQRLAVQSVAGIADDVALTRALLLARTPPADALQADALVRSGVAAAAVVLRETATGDVPDTLRSPWAQASGRQPLGAGWVEVRVEDEARRLDLNALPDAVPRLLAVLALDPGLA